MNYRGRLAPSPTGYLHAGHAATFRIAAERARAQDGTLVLRLEDLDSVRCRPHFIEACMSDLSAMGLEWQEGPDCAGLFGPYRQSERMPLYVEALRALAAKGAVYPCSCSRKDIERAISAPHGMEPIYPGTCRPEEILPRELPDLGVSWRFRVSNPRVVRFLDRCVGEQCFKAGVDFGDFPVWRKDGLPAYELAVVVDDAAMAITEVVRGADLLLSTARQLLLYEALGLSVPHFYHCPLVVDTDGRRMSKRDAAARYVRTGGA